MGRSLCERVRHRDALSRRCRSIAVMAGERLIAGVLLFEDVEELDFVGPWEVFGSAMESGAGLEAVTVAERPGLLRCAHGLKVMADCGFDDAPPLDLLVIPGGYGTRKAVDSAATLQWIRC